MADDGTGFHLGTHATPLSYHATLLGDPHRMIAYERAIRALVRPGDVVLDLGCGTGVLAMLAARRGARVHAVESGSVARVARALVRHNGLDDRVTVHEGDVTALPVAEPVDLVVSDFMGRFLVDDGMLRAVHEARRWMKPTARFCPSRLVLRLAPVEAPLAEIDVFDAPLFGLDLRPARAAALRTCTVGWFGPEVQLGPAADYAEMTPPDPPPPLDRTVRLPIARDGDLTAIAGWFDADMCDGVVLSTGPGVHTHWGQYLFPVPRMPVRRGDVLAVRLALEPPADDPEWSWEVALHRAGRLHTRLSLDSRQARAVPVEADRAPRRLDAATLATVLDRARAHAAQGRHAEARADLELVTHACGPDDDAIAREAHAALGAALLRLGQPLPAATALLRALDGDPAWSEDACRALVESFEAAGRPVDAATWRARLRER